MEISTDQFVFRIAITQTVFATSSDGVLRFTSTPSDHLPWVGP
jgi:hypothetical protein